MENFKVGQKISFLMKNTSYNGKIVKITKNSIVVLDSTNAYKIVSPYQLLNY